jgi:prevent-host-death family protein
MPRAKQNPPGHWPLQDAKARFSEVVRRARQDGPQYVTVHGRDEVVIMTAEESAASRATAAVLRSSRRCKPRHTST